MLNVIARLRQQIRVLRMRKRAKMTSRERDTTTLVRPPKKKVRNTAIQPVVQSTAEEESIVQTTDEEQSVVQTVVEEQSTVQTLVKL